VIGLQGLIEEVVAEVWVAQVVEEVEEEETKKKEVT
jgi:hypothetical protein